MRAVILLALLGAAMAGPHRVPQRIVGGTPTTVEKYPFIANMQYHWWGIAWMQWCGGSLISNRVTLTAAHCVEGDQARQWQVRLGTSLSSSGGTPYQVQRIVTHPGYHGSHINNDVAVLWLTDTVVFNNAIQPISLAGANYHLQDNTLVTTIGWGALAPGGASPEQLQEVDIYTINHQLCTERYAYLKSLPGFGGWPDVTEQMLCAGILDVGGKDACQGDSGGPLVHGQVQIGVVSWGYSCADPVYPGINARISALIEWIVANAQ